MTDDGAIMRLAGVKRVYRQGGRSLEVLHGVDLAIQPGELVALVGPSGTGKSTLLHLAGLLEYPDAGTIAIDGRDCGRLRDIERTRIRRESLGFVYQFHHLLPEFTALENVILPQMIAGTPRRAARIRGEELLERVGLADRLGHTPSRLSGGEQQRVAIARGLANRPLLLLADEPTGNLDPETALHVIGHLTQMARADSRAALIATHNPEIARRMDRTLTLDSGTLR